MKTFRYIREGGLDGKLDKYVSDEIKKRKLARFPVNATDDYKMKRVNQHLHFHHQLVQWSFMFG